MENKDYKTITMPLWEYLELKEKASKEYVRACGATEEEVKDMKNKISRLRRYVDSYRDECYYKDKEIAEKDKLIRDLEDKIRVLKQKKWWQFWKR